MRQRLADVKRLGLAAPEEALAEIFEAAQWLPPPEATALVHGDLHFRHLLLTGRQQLSGIIDCGDLHLGDPAVDLHLYWSLLPSAGREAFLAEYSPVSPDSLLRARRRGVPRRSPCELWPPGRHERGDPRGAVGLAPGRGGVIWP